MLSQAIRSRLGNAGHDSPALGGAASMTGSTVKREDGDLSPASALLNIFFYAKCSTRPK